MDLVGAGECCWLGCRGSVCTDHSFLLSNRIFPVAGVPLLAGDSGGYRLGSGGNSPQFSPQCPDELWNELGRLAPRREVRMANWTPSCSRSGCVVLTGLACW